MTATVYEKSGHYYILVQWNEHGKRFRKNCATGLAATAKNKRKAEKLRQQTLAEWEQKICPNYSDILFSDYLRLWLEEIEPTVSPSTFYEYRLQVNNRICPWFDERSIKLVDLTAQDIEAFYRKKLFEEQVKAVTIHRYHSNIHKALRRAVQTGRLRQNPADNVLMPQKQKYIGAYYTVEELRYLLEHVRGESIEVPVTLAIWLGFRRGEAIGLRWSDVDFARSTICVQGSISTRCGRKTKSADAIYYKAPKTPSSYRVLALPRELSTYLHDLRRRQQKQRLLLGSAYHTEWSDYVCVDAVGQLIKPDLVTRNFPLLLERIGLRHIRFHDLRHSCATLLLEEGASLKEVQDWLGHKNFTLTADTYAHVTVRARSKLAATLSDAIVPKPSRASGEK